MQKSGAHRQRRRIWLSSGAREHRKGAHIGFAVIIGLIALLGLAAAGVGVYRRGAPRPAAERQESVRRAESTKDGASVDIPAHSPAIVEGLIDESFKLAFGVTRFDYQILGDHAEVLQRVSEAVATSVHRKDYFPRRPMSLPKLLQALNDDEVSRRVIVRLILEDPALAGSVLKSANSVFYRVSPEPVESLDRAVLVLGTEGLRRLMAVAILQPVFRLPRGYFESFAAVTWEQAQRSAAAAEACAAEHAGIDAFVAQLLGLLSSLARIVIFRVTMEMYRGQPHLLPRAEVFIRSMQNHGPALAKLIAAHWELSSASLNAIDEQVKRTPPGEMSELGRALYFGELCGVLALLHARGMHSAEGAGVLLREQGLGQAASESAWNAATASLQS